MGGARAGRWGHGHRREKRRRRRRDEGRWLETGRRVDGPARESTGLTTRAGGDSRQGWFPGARWEEGRNAGLTCIGDGGGRARMSRRRWRFWRGVSPGAEGQRPVLMRMRTQAAVLTSSLPEEGVSPAPSARGRAQPGPWRPHTRRRSCRSRRPRPRGRRRSCPSRRPRLPTSAAPWPARRRSC